MFNRLIHLWNAMQTSWQSDPAARGAGKMALGAVLLFEGVFGTIRSIGSNGKGGIAGGVGGVVIGIVFIFMGGIFEGAKTTDTIVTQGYVANNELVGQGEGGRTMYRPVFAYMVDGEEYTVKSHQLMPGAPEPGTKVSIEYSVGNPQKAFISSKSPGQIIKKDDDKYIEWMPVTFQVVGWLSLVSAIFSLLISFALIAFGFHVFRQGMLDRKLARQTADSGSGSFVKDLLSLFSKIKSGEMKVEDTAAGHSGKSDGSEANNS